MFESLLKAAVGVVTLPVSAVADVVTLGGTLNDRREAYLSTTTSAILQNLEQATKPE